MGSKRVTCPNCNYSFFPENGVSLDYCPVCGRTVEVHPAPAPLPSDLICAEVFFSNADQIGGFSPYAIKGMADKLFTHISDLTRRLAEVDAHADGFEQMQADDAACAARYLNECIALRARLAEAEAAYKHVKECLHTSQDRAQRAEERIQELEDMQND